MEIREILSEKGFPDKDIDNAVLSFKRKNYINDKSLAEFLIKKFLYRKKGRNFVQSILEKRKISPRMIEQSMKHLYPARLERLNAETLSASLKGKKPPSRILFFLRGKGFSEETLEIIREEFYGE